MFRLIFHSMETYITKYSYFLHEELWKKREKIAVTKMCVFQRRFLSRLLNSNSVSIPFQVPYNMERLLLLFSDMNHALVDSLMQEFEQKHTLKIPQDIQLKVMNCLLLTALLSL